MRTTTGIRRENKHPTPLEIGQILNGERLEYGSVKSIHYKVGKIKSYKLSDFKSFPEYLNVIEKSKKEQGIYVSTGFGDNFAPLGRYEIPKSLKSPKAIFYVDDDNIQLFGISEITIDEKQASTLNYAYETLKGKLQSLVIQERKSYHLFIPDQQRLAKHFTMTELVERLSKAQEEYNFWIEKLSEVRSWSDVSKKEIDKEKSKIKKMIALHQSDLTNTKEAIEIHILFPNHSRQ